MIGTLKNSQSASPRDTVEALILDLGLRRFLALSLRVVFARRRRNARRARSIDLDNHLRRDIGLPPLDRPPELRGPLF